MNTISNSLFDRIKREADLQYDELVCKLEQQAPVLENRLGKSLTEHMKILRDRYDYSSINPARHVVISYLRTGLLDRHPLYLIAMYDQTYLFSENEYTVMWDIPGISNMPYEIADRSIKNFQDQIKVEVQAYYWEKILFLYAERFNDWFMKHMPDIIGCHLADRGWKEFYAENAIRISAGEYRNHIKRIFEWRK